MLVFLLLFDMNKICCFFLKKKHSEISYHFSIDYNQSLLYSINIFFTYVFFAIKVFKINVILFHTKTFYIEYTCISKYRILELGNQISCVYERYMILCKLFCKSETVFAW